MEAIAWAALPFAAGAGYFGWAAVSEHLQLARRRKSIASLFGPAEENRFVCKGFSATLLQGLVAMEQRKGGRLREAKGEIQKGSGRSAAYSNLLNRADLKDRVSVETCYSARRRWAILSAAAGFLMGLPISNELAALLGVAGAVGGFLSVKWALQQEASGRLKRLDHELPEMLEVVALGLRSGLSFERSFQLYVHHFDGVFAKSCASAQSRWLTGLETREEALRRLAASYEAPVLNRAVQSMVRALRFGTSLAQTLEEAAREARAMHKASRQEQVAKAPVKMMIPTGALILPAMLIMVLGPMLLELMAGF